MSGNETVDVEKVTDEVLANERNRLLSEIEKEYDIITEKQVTIHEVEELLYKINQEIRKREEKRGPKVIHRCHEQCNDCAYEKVDAPPCNGHAPGETHCSFFKQKETTGC